MVRTFIVSSEFNETAFKLWLAETSPFDTAFLHRNRYRTTYTLAIALRPPRSADRIVPSACRYKARVVVPSAVGGLADRVWDIVVRWCTVVSVDPRTLARRHGFEGERRRRFVMREINEGALPNRASNKRAPKAVPDSRSQVLAEAGS